MPIGIVRHCWHHVSPLRQQEVVCADPLPLYSYLVKELNKFNLLYIHMVEPRINTAMDIVEVDESKKSLQPYKQISNATFIAAGG